MSNSDSSHPPPTVSSEPLEAPLSQGLPPADSLPQAQDRTQNTPEENPHKPDKPFGDFEKHLQDFRSNDQEKQQAGLIGIDETLTQIDLFQQRITDDIPKLIEALKREETPDLQKICGLSVLAKICHESVQQTSRIIENGAIPILLKSLESSNLEVQKNVIDLIDIIADFPKFKELLRTNGAFVSFINMLKYAKEEEIIEKGVCTLSTFSKDESRKDSEAVKMAITTLCEIVKQQTKETKLLSKILQTLLLLSQTHEEIRIILESEVLPCLINDLNSTDFDLVVLILRILENIAKIPFIKIEMIAPASFIIKKLFGLRDHEENNIRKQSWKILASITTPKIWLEFILKNPEYVEKILEAAKNDTEELRVKIVGILLKMIEIAKIDDLVFMADKGVLSFMHRLAKEEEVEKLQIMICDDLSIYGEVYKILFRDEYEY